MPFSWTTNGASVPPDVKVAFCGHAGAPSPVLGFGPRIQVSPVLTSVCRQQSAAGPVCHPSLVMIGRASGGPDPARVAVQAVGWLTENTDHGSVAGRTVLRPGRTDTNKPRLLTLKSLQAGKRARRPCLTQDVLLTAACCRWVQLVLSSLGALLRDSPLVAS